MRGDGGLKCLQWLIRGIQLFSGALILAVYSYFLATLGAHDFHISTRIRAVEGISGSSVLYALLGVLLICCVGGFPLASFVAIILDTGFLAAFIYVAVANKDGSGSCKGEVNTPYGRGLAKSRVKGKRGSLALPTYRAACQLQTACLAAAIIALFFFFFSILISIALSRTHYKQKRDDNKNYGYGERSVFLGGFPQHDGPTTFPDNLPSHVDPQELDESQNSIIDGREGANDHICGCSESSYDYRCNHEHAQHPRMPDPPYPV